MSARKKSLKPAAVEVPIGPPPPPMVSAFRAEVQIEISSRLRATFAEPNAEEAAKALKLYQATVKREGATPAEIASMRAAVWSLLLSAETRADAKSEWAPAPEGWRESLWREHGLFSIATVIRVWGLLFRDSIIDTEGGGS